VIVCSVPAHDARGCTVVQAGTRHGSVVVSIMIVSVFRHTKSADKFTARLYGIRVAE
jgi:hypothetical protein